MAKPAVDCDEMPSHPDAPKKATSSRGNTNSYVTGKGKGTKKGRKRVAKK
jgi:hypothetical protein